MLFRDFDNKILSEAEILHEKGFAVETMGPDSRAYRFARLALPSRIHAKWFHLNGRPIPIIDPRMILRQLIMVLSGKSKICHCYGMSELLCGVALKALGRVVIYDIGDDSPSIYGVMIGRRLRSPQLGDFIQAVLRTFEGLFCRFFDQVIALTELLNRNISQYKARTVTIGYYPDPCFNPSNVDSSLTREYERFNVVIYDGRIMLEKGMDPMLRVADILRAKIPSFRLLLIGDFTSTQSGKRFARRLAELGLDRYVRISGWMPYHDVPKYINLGRVGLCLLSDWCYSYIVTEPYKILELMACGKPVVATGTNVPGRQLIQNSEGGILVKLSDLDAAADHIARLLLDDREAQEIGAKARKYIQDHRKWSEFEDKLLSIYLQYAPDPRGNQSVSGSFEN